MTKFPPRFPCHADERALQIPRLTSIPPTAPAVECIEHHWPMTTTPFPETFDEALDEVERQLREMPVEEVLASEDLEWSVGSFFVVATASGARPTVVNVEASRGVIRRSSQRRTVVLD